MQSANKSTVAFADDYFCINLNGEKYPRTICTTACELLVQGTKCVACKQYRSTLRSLHSRKLKLPKSDTTAVSSHSNICYLKTPERRKRMTRLKVAVDAKTAEVNRKMKEIELLKSKSRKSTNRCGIYVTKEFEDNLTKIMEEYNDQICQKYPSDSFHHIFWSQQLEALRVRDKRQIRWHPMMIRWCLSLKLISSASYHALRSSNLLILPSERPLRDYIPIMSRQNLAFNLKLMSNFAEMQNLTVFLNSKNMCV